MSSSPFLVHIVSKEEYQEHLRTRKPFAPHYAPFFQIGVHQPFDAYSFLCRIYHNNGTGYFRILMENDKRTISPLIDYFEKGKEFFVTANGINYYKVLDIRTDVNKHLEVALRLITDNAYVEQNHFFMVMPFREKSLNDFYVTNIKEFLKKKANIKVFRADDFNDTDVIIDTIFREIEKSEFVICDITRCNKNVFFEVGYAKALNKQLIFLFEEGQEHNFFDVAHIRRIEYSLDRPEVFQARLFDTIESMRGKR